MRDYIFRGRTKDDGRWVYGSLVKCDDSYYILPYDGCYGFNGSSISVDPETVGQWTGLHDVNGKRIFEGDVEELPGWVVTYLADRNEGYGMAAGWYIQRDDFESWCELDTSVKHVVIGNIHDNPELRSSRCEK